MLRGRPGGFRFNVDPVARMFETHSRIVFRSGKGARRPSLKCLRNALCVAITDSLFLKNVSTTKPRCSPDQPMVSSENGKIAANQRDHSHHYTPSTARAVTPPKVELFLPHPVYYLNLIEDIRIIPSKQDTLMYNRLFLNNSNIMISNEIK